jgi:hypothetical protein
MTTAYDAAVLICAGSIAVSVFFLWRIVGKLLSMWSRMETFLQETNPPLRTKSKFHDGDSSGRTT